MKNMLYIIVLVLFVSSSVKAQYIPIDTSNWKINAQSYVIEPHQGKKSIYLQGGIMTLKDVEFLKRSTVFQEFISGGSRSLAMLNSFLYAPTFRVNLTLIKLLLWSKT